MTPSGCPVDSAGFHGQTISFTFDLPDSTRPDIGDKELPVPSRRIWATYEVRVDKHKVPISFRLIGFGDILPLLEPAHVNLAFDVQLLEGNSHLQLIGYRGWCPASYEDQECWEYARGRNPQNLAYTHGEFAFCLYNEAARDTSDPYAASTAASICDGEILETPLPPLPPSVNIEGPGSFPSGEIHTWTAAVSPAVPGGTYRWLMATAFGNPDQSYPYATEVGQGPSWTGTAGGSSYLYVEVRDAAQQLLARDDHYVFVYVYSGGSPTPSISISGPTSVQHGSTCTWSAATKSVSEPYTVVWSVSTGGAFVQAEEGNTFTYSASPGSLTIRAKARRSDGSQITSKDQAVAVTSDAPGC